MSGRPSRRTASLLAALSTVAALAACGGTPAVQARRATAMVLSPDPDDAKATCATPGRSLAPIPAPPPPNAMPAGSSMAAIHDRGYLIAAVPRGTLRFGSIDPADNEPSGFDVDMVKQISKAIFGDENHVEYRFVTAGDRIPLLKGGTIDIVSATFTITCGRWNEVAFSTSYYRDTQRVLVSKRSPISSLDKLGAGKVCATSGSTSIYYLHHGGGVPAKQVIEVSDNNDCLVRLQRGSVDAVSTNSGILYGLQQEDPYTQVVGPTLVEEWHGIGANLCHKDLVRFVDGVLDRMRADGTWQMLYDKWLKPWLGPVSPPAPDYGDPSPPGACIA